MTKKEGGGDKYPLRLLPSSHAANPYAISIYQLFINFEKMCFFGNLSPPQKNDSGDIYSFNSESLRFAIQVSTL